jgi:DNA repair photolyase
VATVRITLPDDLARELAEAGLLEPQVIESILRDRLRATRVADFGKLRAALRVDPLEPMTGDEINAEIEAYRAE